MSKTIREIYNQSVRTDGVGIEVEVEAESKLPDTIGGVWLAKSDGSLRGYAYEYVCRQPIKVDNDKIKHIRVLTDKLNTPTVKLAMSSRTSVHVHRNVQGFTPAEVWTAILAYWMVEGPLMDFCGPSRKGNLFCLPLYECEGVLRHCEDDIKRGRKPFDSIRQSYCKYGGQNLATVRTFGSLEYRGMRGTTDPQLIDKWSTALYELGTNAKERFGTPDRLMDFYIDSSKDQMLNTLLPADFVELIKSSPNYVGLIRENVLRLCDLAYSQPDWRAWEKKASEPPAPKKKPELMAEHHWNQVQAQMQPVNTTAGNISWSTTSTNGDF